MKYYGLIGNFTSQPGKQDELTQILLQAAMFLEKNPDCIHYVVSVSKEEEEKIWVSEVWKSKEAHDISLEPEEIRNLITSARPLIADMQQIVESSVLGGKGV